MLSDQYETTSHELRSQLDLYDIDLKDVTDMCLYRPHWNSKYDYDALESDWGTGICWVNPPYSLGVAFIYKAIDAWTKGANVFMILPTQTVDNPLFLGIQSYAHVVDRSTIIFKDQTTSLPSPCSWVHLVQPDMHARRASLGRLAPELPAGAKAKVVGECSPATLEIDEIEENK